LAVNVRVPSHPEPHDGGADHSGEQPKERPIRLTDQVSMKFQSLKKGDAAKPDQPDEPF
jgi:hypothetical protein